MNNIDKAAKEFCERFQLNYHNAEIFKAGVNWLRKELEDVFEDYDLADYIYEDIKRTIEGEK